MKSLPYIAVFVTIVSLIEGLQSTEELKQFMEDCRKELGYEEISQNPSDPKMKCLGACMFRKQGFIVDGKISSENIFKTIEKENIGVKDSKRKEEFIICVNKANEKTNECDIGATLVNCLEETRQRNQ